MRPFADVPTPALLLEHGRLDGNLVAMAHRARRLGVRLRPHLKTAKSADVARLAVAGEAGGITVSTLREAEYFADHGFRDIVYAVGIAPAKLERAAAMIVQGIDLKLITDSVDVAEAIAVAASRRKVVLPVLIEIDCGDGRAGLDPRDDEVLELGMLLDEAPGASVAGVLTHAGHAYACRDADAIAAVAETERAAVVRAADRLRGAGIDCPIVSVGSTPTARFARNLDGVTEMRPGVYMFGDLFQYGIGVCEHDAIALSVLATVIGHHRKRGHLLLDAGGLALSKDVSANDVAAGVGYGEVCDPVSLESTGLFVQSVSQEHGKVPLDDAADFDRFPVGSLVRVLPNHACMTAAAHDRYVVVDGAEVVDRWERVNTW